MRLATLVAADHAEAEKDDQEDVLHDATTSAAARSNLDGGGWEEGCEGECKRGAKRRALRT